jgi:hypothetical protein
MKDLIIDIEPLMEQGYNAFSIANMLSVDVELVEQGIAYLDEQRYHEDMAADPYRIVS